MAIKKIDELVTEKPIVDEDLIIENNDAIYTGDKSLLQYVLTNRADNIDPFQNQVLIA